MLCSLRGVSDFIIQEALQPVSLSFQRVGKRQPRVRGSWDEELQEEPDRSLGNMKAAGLSTPDCFKFPSSPPCSCSPLPSSPPCHTRKVRRVEVSSELVSEKAVAAHSSVLAWRIPGTAEPGGLPSVGSHRVGHDRSDLAAAAAAAEVVYFAEPPGLTSACSQGRCPGAEGKEGN